MSEMNTFSTVPHSGEMHVPPLIDVSLIVNKYLDIPYSGRSVAQKLDLYLPEEGTGPFPLLIHIHGGAFMMGDKRDIQLTPFLEALKRGYALASINYRMSGEAIFPAAVNDCKAAVRYLRANAEEYSLDGQRFAAIGGSAGGNLTAMVCLTAFHPELADDSLGFSDVSCAVQAGVEWFGPTDFLKMDDQLAADSLGPCDHNEADSPESRYMGGQITLLDPAWIQKANPMTYISEDMPPLFIEHGRKDHLVPYRQSKIFVELIEKKLGKMRVWLETLEDADHADPLFETPENMEKVFNFLSLHL